MKFRSVIQTFALLMAVSALNDPSLAQDSRGTVRNYGRQAAAVDASKTPTQAAQPMEKSQDIASPTKTSESTATVESFRRRQHRPFRVATWYKDSDPLWVRYMALGDAAQKRNDSATAKRYWLGSLAELEKGKNVGNYRQFPALEHRLLYMYPTDWSTSKLSPTDLLTQQQEQVAVYNRLVHITRSYQLLSGTMQEKAVANTAEQLLKQASSDLEKTKLAVTDRQKKKSSL